MRVVRSCCRRGERRIQAWLSWPGPRVAARRASGLGRRGRRVGVGLDHGVVAVFVAGEDVAGASGGRFRLGGRGFGGHGGEWKERECLAVAVVVGGGVPAESHDQSKMTTVVSTRRCKGLRARALWATSTAATCTSARQRCVCRFAARACACMHVCMPPMHTHGRPATFVLPGCSHRLPVCACAGNCNPLETR